MGLSDLAVDRLIPCITGIWRVDWNGMEEGWKNLDFLGAAGWWQAGCLRGGLGLTLRFVAFWRFVWLGVGKSEEGLSRMWCQWHVRFKNEGKMKVANEGNHG
ncbi:uncharacterized protein APUU_21463A [Aspergillus puulaauensis]|uniref:Uncharacterized protein n=1 Tax=Aspergillus puulaauensis TaxID=1220207 RepID=A0A7R7XGJ5_9EURO|nr:uncharacterized protein APUU_21463A [Aspergillus puulaauensis]BCS21031.1 hypothetical protein APUU_21463A [Aspergillus puulaauensis]